MNSYSEESKRQILKWYQKQCKKEQMYSRIPSLSGMNTQKQALTTSGVKAFHIEIIKSKLTSIIGEPTKIKVEPLLLRNCCHWNCEKMDIVLNKNRKNKKFESVLGYNITGCPCGKMFSLELHSVLKDKETNQYIDLTTDFAGETEKWFVPIKQRGPYIDIIADLQGLKAAYYHHTQGYHRCNGTAWKKGDESLETIEDFSDAVEMAVEDCPLFSEALLKALEEEEENEEECPILQTV
jgi:hypothetical protein